MPDKKAKGHPVDYKVPNFGVDEDIKATHEHLAHAEEKLEHKWIVKDKPKDPPINYFVPNFGPDEDIAMTQESEQMAIK